MLQLLARVALVLLACPRGSVQPAASVSLQRKVGLMQGAVGGARGRERQQHLLRGGTPAATTSAAAALASPLPTPPALDPNHVVPIGPAPTFLLGHGPAVPRVVSRTDTSVKLSWAAPPGAVPVLYNLLMNRVSVYSGPNTYFEETGLEPEKCYTFQVAAYVDGRWTQFSPALRVASMEHAVDIQRVDQAVKATRKHIKNAAMARITGEPCLLNGIDDASNVNGGPGYVEYIGSTGDFTVAGVEASVLNCQVSKCVDASKQSLSLVQPMVGHLLVRLDDGSWKLRFMEIPPESNILEYNNPKNAFMKITINLLGCRANRVTSPISQKLIGKSGPAAAKCLELNCTSEWKQYFFCVPPVPGAEAAAEGSLLNIGTWIGNMNRASMPHHTFQRYEVALKAVVSPLIPDNPIKHLDKTVFSPSGYREPFFLSWLTRLVKIDATPHFPQLLGTFRCTDLPDAFASAPAVKQGGYLPPYRTGGPAASNAAKMKIDGDTFDMLWMVSVQETFSTDLQTILDGFKGYALDNEWVRAVTFMLIDAVGVGFHSYGLHHNDLLTMSNIRFKQIPRQTASSQKYWCYDFNDDALSGDGCGGKGGGKDDESVSGSGEDEEDEHCDDEGSGGESDGDQTKATSLLELGIDVRAYASAPTSVSAPDGSGDESPPFAGHVDKDSKPEFQCLHGVSAAGELPADALPLSTCEAINDGSAEETGASGSAASVEGDSASEAGAADIPAERHSWCILADAVDGMQLKLYNFGAASMAKKAIQWWKKGYTFPNTPWYDDLQSVAVVLCGYMARHVAEFDPRGRDLCKQMREGSYRANPLHALRHPYFEDYLKKQEVSIEERNNYVYKPSKDCSCDNEPNEKDKKKKKKKCKKKDGSKEEDGVDEGQEIVVRLKGGNDKRGKDGDVAPDVDAIKAPHLDNSDQMDSPSAHSPMTPWIVSQVAAQPTGSGTSGRIKVAINWKKFQGAELYNFMLDGVSVYTGPNTAVELDNLIGAKCYRAQVAAFTMRGWTPLSHALHLNDCGIRSE